MSKPKNYLCVHCSSYVDPKLADDPPGVHAGNDGTAEQPRAPGDHRDCCENCCYGEEVCKTISHR